jgi:ribosomal protein S27E
MGEVTALNKHPCPECGGESAWNPARQALVCPYCGTIVPGQPKADGSGIAEHDLAAALRNIPDSGRGWQEKKISVKCQSCNAISVFDPGRAAQRCDFCGSPAILPYEETRDPIRPESLLPIKLAEAAVRDSLRQWYGTRWFAPNRLKKAALTDTLKGVYLPYWTFDAKAHADWTAESGYHYYITETYTDANGNQQTRQVQQTRWEPSSGSVDHFFDDELISGSTGIDAALLTKIEPFPTSKELVPYDASFIRGWIVERYQIDLARAAQRSEERMNEEMHALCARQVPGDTYRNLDVQTEYFDRTFKHVLLPIWLVTYTYGTKNFQVIVNGYTGVMAGRRPYSWIKIMLAVLAGLAVAGLLALVFAHR